ncbi:MAG TPA: MarR family transcriptional regulator [Geminicoccus sp.]|uniref:MarR family winged helix-turn-helix transcriptional regulator n=1 Tax=Geminicoccus sp. TaxID=2024832 RepID=UPI002E36E358|nr:MarR family transcriptional regulator [Geminicoccus sp.]HEX2526363.1 MarR family transcriptional regulator [Geminicoccus sp.]
MTDRPKHPPHLEDQLCYAIYSAGMAIQRAYRPLLDSLRLTYPQYLVLNVLWREDGQTVGSLAEQLALETSTLTPLLKRLEAAQLVRRTRNPQDERQVIVALTDQGRALEDRAGCLGEALLEASGQSPADLGDLNLKIRRMRDGIYSRIGRWSLDRS